MCMCFLDEDEEIGPAIARCFSEWAGTHGGCFFHFIKFMYTHGPNASVSHTSVAQKWCNSLCNHHLTLTSVCVVHKTVT